MKQFAEKNLLDRIFKVAKIYPADSAMPIIFHQILKTNIIDMKGAKIRIGNTYLSLYRKDHRLFVSKMSKRKEYQKTISNHILETGYYREQSLHHNGINKIHSVRMHLKMINFMKEQKAYINNVKLLLSYLKKQTNTDFLYEFDNKNMKLKEFIFPIVEDAYRLDRLGYYHLKGSNAVEIIEEIIEKDNNFDLFSQAALKDEISFFKAKIKSKRKYLNANVENFIP